MAVTGAIAASVAVSAYAANQSAKASREAGELQAGSAGEATALQRDIFNQTRADLAPARATGASALDALSDLFLPGGAAGVQAKADTAALEQERAGLTAQLAEAQAKPGTAGFWRPGIPFQGSDGGTGGAGDQSKPVWVPASGPADTSGIESQIAAIDAKIATAQQGGAQPSIRDQIAATEIPYQNDLGQSFREATGENAFFKSPSFNFVQKEGEDAIQRRLSALGLSNSGNVFREASQFNTGLASEEYGNFYNRTTDEFNNKYSRSSNNFNDFVNRLGQLAGVGATATANSGNAGQNFANQAGSNFMAAGSARASGVVGAANARNEGLNNAAFAIRNGVNQQQPQQYDRNALATTAQADVRSPYYEDVF